MTLDQKHDLRARIVEAARSQVGVREIGHTNTGPQVNEYLASVNVLPGNSWCMAFAIWCILHACHVLGLDFGQLPVVKTGYCPSQADHARAKGLLVSADDASADTVQPGDLMLEWEGNLGDYHHTGIVIEVPSADGDFVTVEGNTNQDGGREGCEVAVQHRNTGDTASDGHPKYAFAISV